MSCNGCRILRKGCSESCILRPCLQWIDTPEAQGHATVFVAKFFGRAGLMSFISNVPPTHRPALFQSLLYEACGRTVNPVNGAVGLLWTGNWNVCQAAVETVLRGGTLRPIPEFLNGIPMPQDVDEASEVICAPNNTNNNYLRKMQDLNSGSNSPPAKTTFMFPKRKRSGEGGDDRQSPKAQSASLDLSLAPPKQIGFGDSAMTGHAKKLRRPATPSRNSEEESAMTRESFESGLVENLARKRTTLLLFPAD
ncbi:LOB domain-containing protein 38 [Dionaea muscipula]